MSALLGPREIRELAGPLGISPRKSLGQNFVIDPNTIRRIVRLAELREGEHVLEVGPGLGSLTLGLLAAGHPVTAVELDRRLAAALPQTVGDRLPEAVGRIRVVAADAATITVPDVTDATVPTFAQAPTALVANLPYNVAVPVLLHALAMLPGLRRVLVMVQLEVADRLAAAPGSKTYGIPSVKAAWYGQARRVATVPPAVFWPAPRVASGLVLLRAWDDPAQLRGSVSRNVVFEVVDRLFAQRRKTIRHSLRAWLGASTADDALAQSGLSAEARPEQLSLPDFVRLAERLPPGD